MAPIIVPEAFVAVAIEAADLARKHTLKYFRSDLTIHQKQDLSPVTLADRETEQAIKDFLHSACPEHGFYGEETGQTDAGNDWLWVVDPIDGTASFSTGKPTFGTLIALAYKGVPVLGLVDIPALDERWLGVAGKATLYNGSTVVQTRTTQKLAAASLYCTTPHMFDELTLAFYQRLAQACKLQVFGADCFAYGLLASGHTELVFEADLKPYDYMALVPVIEGAGGTITDWQGKALTINSKDQVLAAANQSLHAQAIQLLANNERP